MDEEKVCDLLQSAIREGIINLGDVESKVIEMKKKNALKYHKHKVWYSESQDRWFTYLPDEVKGRRLVKRKTRESIENAIYECYLNVPDPNSKRREKTLEDVYKEWLVSKAKHTNSSGCIFRIASDWKRFYQGSELEHMAVRRMTKRYLDDWIHEQIKKYQMSKTCYYNMSIILRQGLDYAVEVGYIKGNPFRQIKVEPRMFFRKKKQDDGSQVFLEDEQKQIEKEAYRRFCEKPYITNPLAICLAFQLGTRPCETVAIKFSDISGNYIHIQRMEVRDYEMDMDKIEMKSAGVKVVSHTKSDAGDRYIYLTEKARAILQLIKESNETYHNYYDDYVFVRDNKRVEVIAVTNKLLKLCRAIGMNPKRCHKIRKTWISTLIDSDLNISKIREMAGHTDERTTYRNYCFNRKTVSETENIIERALSSCKEKI